MITIYFKHQVTKKKGHFDFLVGMFCDLPVVYYTYIFCNIWLVSNVVKMIKSSSV